MATNNLKMRFFQRIIIEDICYLQTFEKKTLMVSFTGKQSIIQTPLSHFEKQIEPNNQFLRISKRYIVNRSFIKKMDDKYVTMTNGLTFPKSRCLTPSEE